MIRLRRLAIALDFGSCLAALAGCGGGGSSLAPPPPPPPPPQLRIVTASPLPRAILGTSYSVTLQATGGVPPYSWSSQLLGIPGMTLSSDGVLSGTPALQATFIPNITVTDSKGGMATASIELDVFAPLAFATQSTLADLNIALPVYMYIAATGGLQPYTYSLTSGSTMPPGLTFTNSNGVALIQGTPTTPGKYSFTVQVTDSFAPPTQVTQTFSLNILNGLVVPNTALPDAVQNLPYREQIKPAGGTPPYHFLLGQFSSTPPGLTLDSNTGIVSGTPTTPTQFTDTMLVLITDSSPTPTTINPFITLNVQPPLAFQTTTLPDGVRNLNYGTNVGVVGGRGPYTLSLASGTLPDGISIFNFPTQYLFGLFGAAQKDGTFSFALKITDSYETPNTVTKSFQIRISDQISLTGPSQTQLLFGQSYSATFPVTGGIPPYTWRMSEVPQGFTFDPAAGTLTGTGVGGTFVSPIVFVNDSSNPPQSTFYVGFSLNVYAKLAFFTSSLPPITTNSTTWLGLHVTGGGGPYTWSVVSGSVPLGMNFTNIGGNGTITGSPNSAGAYNFTVKVVDGNSGSLQQTVTSPLTLVVKDPAQMQRNDSPATATPLSNMTLLASISPFTDAKTIAPDADYYSASAAPGSIIQLYTSPNNDFLQPPEPNSLQPVLEIVDATGTRYQTCAPAQPLPTQTYNFPCVNHLPGSNFLSGNFYSFQVPGSGSTPVTFYVRVSDARGDARPDFIYTFSIYGVN